MTKAKSYLENYKNVLAASGNYRIYYRNTAKKTLCVMFRWLIFLCLIFVLSFTYGQNTCTSWQKIDTIPNSDDIINDVLQMPDSGYILAGTINTPAQPYPDNLLIRTNKNGDTLWTKKWGSTLSDRINKISNRPGGGFIAAGGNYSSNFLFLDSAGNVVSSHYFGPFYFNDFIILPDSGCIFTGSTPGYTTSDVAIMRTDKNGDTLWTKLYGTSRADVGNAIAATSDGNFVVAGSANYSWVPDGFYYPSRAYLLKIDLLGNLLWFDTIPGSIVSNSVAIDVLENFNGEYVISGGCSAYRGMIANYSSAGALNWFKEYSNPNASQGYMFHSFGSIIQKCDGGYITVGYEDRPSLFSSEGLVVSTNSLGDIQFINTYGDSTESVILNRIIGTLDNGFFVGGYSIGDTLYTENPYLLKLDGQAGNSNLWVISSNFISTDTSYTAAFTDLSNGATNWHWDFGDGNYSTNQNPVHAYSLPIAYNVCLTTWNYCDSAFFCDTIVINDTTTSTSYFYDIFHDMNIYPLPSSSIINLSFESNCLKKASFRIFDLTYKDIIILEPNATIHEGENYFTFNISNLSQGMFFLECSLDHGEKYIMKIIKID
jgi:hypothetical protein